MNKKTFWVVAACALVQYYDYNLFGLLAAKISHNFIPAVSVTGKMLTTYFIMGIAVIAKPLGALVLGKLGDMYGRSSTFTISLIGTSIASAIISVIPTYNQIGLIALIILLIARMAVCALASSGTDGIRLYIYEHIGEGRQSFGNGLSTSFTQTGAFIASLSAFIFTLDILPSYAWRGAFLLGSLLGIGVIYLKSKFQIIDSQSINFEPNFDEFKSASIIKVILTHKKLFIYSCMLAGCIGASNQFMIIFFGTYNFEILKNIPESAMQMYTSVAIFLNIIFAICGGYIVDRVGTIKIGKTACVLILFLSFSQIYYLRQGHMNVIVYLLSSMTMPFILIPALTIFKGSIPKVIRYRIFSLAHAIGSICISAPTAFLSTFLYFETSLPYTPMIYFILIISLIMYILNNLPKINKF